MLTHRPTSRGLASHHHRHRRPPFLPSSNEFVLSAKATHMRKFSIAPRLFRECPLYNCCLTRVKSPASPVLTVSAWFSSHQARSRTLCASVYARLQHTFQSVMVASWSTSDVVETVRGCMQSVLRPFELVSSMTCSGAVVAAIEHEAGKSTSIPHITAAAAATAYASHSSAPAVESKTASPRAGQPLT